MGVITFLLAISAVYAGFHVAKRGLHTIAYALAVARQAILALGRAAHALSHPPGSTTFSGGPTLWRRAWYLTTLGPLRALFAPGSFGCSYALLVGPALVVAAVACLALLARCRPAVELLRAALRAWRHLAGAAACLASVLLLEDAVRVYGLMGRLFPATLRGSAAAIAGFCGLVGVLGPPEAGGFSRDQTLEWLRALSLSATCATSGVGAATLLLRGALIAAASASTAATATATAAADPPLAEAAADRLSFMLYGTVLLLVAAASAAAMTESDVMARLAVAAVRLLRVRTLLAAAAAARLARWVGSLPLLRAMVAATRSADRVVTSQLVAAARRAAEATRGARAAARRALHWLAAAMRVALPWLAAAAASAHRRLLLPLARAARAAALALYRVALRPAALAAWDLLRRRAAPLAWPAGTAAGALWFGREAAAQRGLLAAARFGGAAVACGLIAALMAGKILRKSRRAAVSRVGSSLERLAAAAYLRLDLGLGRLAVRLLATAVAVASVTAQLLAAAGRKALALLTAPLAGLLAAALTAAAWAWARVWRLVGRPLTAAARGVHAALAATWTHPELALVLAALVLAAAYGAHAAQLSAAAWRAAAAWAAWTYATAAASLSHLLAPPLRLLSAAVARAAALGGRSGAAAAAALQGWGRRSGTDLSSLFGSDSFASAFLGLNLLHAALLRGWAVPALQTQGPAGRAAVLPVISFVARSTGKVALGPMYLSTAAAAACLLAGAPGGGVGLGSLVASLGTPTLWAIYLAAMWLEGVRRVKLSYDPAGNDSEFGRALRSARTGSAPVPAGPAASAPAATAAAAAAAAPAAAGAAPGAPTTQRPFPARPAAAAAPAADPAVQLPAAARSPVPVTSTPRRPLPRDLEPHRRLYDEILAQGPAGHVFSMDSCAVCLEELRLLPGGAAGSAEDPAGRESGQDGDVGSEREEEAPLALHCGHTFHAGCILVWLHRVPRCPVCREAAVGWSRHSNLLF